jgi:hypothetical protein
MLKQERNQEPPPTSEGKTGPLGKARQTKLSKRFEMLKAVYFDKIPADLEGFRRSDAEFCCRFRAGFCKLLISG